MTINWPTKKLGEIAIKIILLVFSIAFFYESQYAFSFLSLCLFFLSLRLDNITEFVDSIKDGFKAKYQIPEEKIRQDIKENEEPVNKKTLINFKQIEEMVLRNIHKKIGGLMKRQIHFVYGNPPNFEFAYTPDAVIQTDKELVFVEIKYVSKHEFTNKIIRDGIEQLKTVLEKFEPSAGKKLVTELVLASNFEIDVKKYEIPEGMKLEFYKL